MKVLEFEAKQLLLNEGFTVPLGQVVSTAAEARTAATSIEGEVVLKAQIPSGGRMKAGGVRFAKTPAEASTIAKGLLGTYILDLRVEQLLVEQKLSAAAELFFSVSYDAESRSPLILATNAGGIDVESVGNLVRRTFAVSAPAPDYLGREIAAELGYSGGHALQLGQLITRLARCFLRWDALLLEVNPLIQDTAGHWWLADVHLELDEDAAPRQAELLSRLTYSRRWATPHSEFERQAGEIDRTDHRGVAGRLVSFEGNLGLLIGGGGASLAIFDAILDAGLRPANYCEVGGNPSVWKVKEITKLILGQPGVERLAVLMNVVSNTRVDLVARGVIAGIMELGLEPRRVLAVFRLPGSWEDEGQAILRHYGIPFFGREASLDEAVEAITWPS